MVSTVDMKSIQDYVETLGQPGIRKLRTYCNSVLSEYFDTCLTRFPSVEEQDKFELAVEVMARLDSHYAGNGAQSLSSLRQRYFKVYDLNLDTLNFASN